MKLFKFSILFLLSLVLFASFSIAKSLNEQKVSNGDLVELNKAFDKLLKSDGHVAEELDIIIGKSIISNPINFIKAYKKYKSRLKRLDALVGNLGYDFVDDFPKQAIEKRKRIDALSTVSDSKLKPYALECIKELRKQLKVVER